MAKDGCRAARRPRYYGAFTEGKGGAVLPRFHLAADVDRQIDAADREGRLGGQRDALELAARGRIAHRLLELALRGHADLLEELAPAHVECVCVHGNPPASGGCRECRV